MKKITLFLIAIIMASSYASAGTGWFNDFLTLKVNGVEAPNNYYIGADPATGAIALQGTNFGTVSSLEMSNIDLKYWADNGDDRTGGSLFFKIMSEDGNTQVVAPFEIIWAHASIGGNNYQGTKPAGVVGSMSFLKGLSSGTYQLHIWAKSWGTGGDSYLSNNAANYVATFTVNRPVTISGTLSNIDDTYETLKTAFDSINAHKDYSNKDIEIKIAGNTTETASAVLNQPITATWNTLTIYPTNTNVTIGGVISTNLIDLNGADKVTIIGKLNKTGTAKMLSINNTGSGSGIRLYNDAVGNNISYCKLAAANIVSPGGVIYLATAAVTGNDNNTIEYNDINALGSANGINSVGTATFDNSGNKIMNNNIFDFYINNTSTTITNGINIGANNTEWTISGNSLYQTAPRAYAATATFHYGIFYSSGVNNVVENNYIGGSAPLAGGTPWTVTGGLGRPVGMYTQGGTTAPSSVQGNVITNYDITTDYVANAASAFIGHWHTAGAVNVGTVTGNTIGSTTATGAIKIKFNSAAVGSLVVGINLSTAAGVSMVFSNNKIGGIIIDFNNTVNRGHFYGVSVAGGGTFTFTDNIIGSTTVANSIEHKGSTYAGQVNLRGISTGNSQTFICTGNTIANLTASSTAQMTVNGIYHNGAGSNSSISNNTIRDLKSYGVKTSNGSTAAMVGILFAGNSNTNTIGNNSIYNLNNATATADGVEAYGIFFETLNASASTIENNMIYGITTASTNTNANIVGVYINNGLTTTKNNMISLGNGLTTAYNISGIRKATTKNNNFYHNTVLITGSNVGTAGATYTSAFLKTSSATDEVKNNIFINERSNASGNTQKHYVMNVNDLTTFTSNNNVLSVPVAANGGLTGAVGATDYSSLSNWAAVSDAASKATTVYFTDATTGDLRLTGASIKDANLKVASLAAVTTDITPGKTRNSSFTYAGAYEAELPFPTTGIEKAITNAGIRTTKNGVEVQLNNESAIELYNASGVLIEKTKANGIYSRSLHNGIYIININGKATKFVK